MINTGALLRHPGESDYAVIRRVLIANSGMTPTAIKKALAGMLGEIVAGASPLPADIAVMVRVLEAKRLGSKGCSVSHGDATIRRNCARCAAIAYHCAAYDLPWLTHCPIHHEALTTQCPHCHRPWPSARDLAARRCEVCGVSLTVEGLANRGAFLEKGFEVCEFLVGCIHHPQLPAAVQLNAGPGRSERRQGQLSTADMFFPSLLHICDSHAGQRLSDIGVQLPPAMTINSLHPLAQQESDRSTGLSPRRCAAIRRFVLGNVYRVLCTQAHRVRVIPTSEDILGHRHCTACLAFSIWYYLLTHVDNNARYETIPSFARDLFQRPFVRLYPRMPVPMQRITINNVQYALPTPFAQAVYALDLWTTFTHLARFVESYLGDTHDPAQLISDFLEALPEAAHPDCCISQSVGLCYGNDHSVTLAFPRQLCSFNRDLLRELPCRQTEAAKLPVYGLTEDEYRRFVSIVYPSPSLLSPETFDGSEDGRYENA